LKIVHVNTYDILGGAARAVYRLHSGLVRMGYNSSMYVLNKAVEDQSVKEFVPETDFLSRNYRKILDKTFKYNWACYEKTRPYGYELFSSDKTIYSQHTTLKIPEADIINLHWIAGFLDLNSFFCSIPNHVKVVWTLHDMNAFTGGCHYNMGCERYLIGCGKCPQLGSIMPNDLSSQIWNRKKNIFSQVDISKLHIVTLNEWMASEIRNSPLINKFPLSIVPNGLDTSVFKPDNKSTSRKFLGIKSNARVIMFAADSITNKRKGFEYLVAALSKLKDIQDITLLSVGQYKNDVNIEIEHINVGNISNDKWLANIYNAADIFIAPSIQDNLPNTVMEAISCGIPVVGFDVGGIPDMVRPGLSGLLVKKNDIEGLHEMIRYLLVNDGLRASISKRCRKIAVSEYALEVQAKRYAEIYNEKMV
jgi:glycosyltransferase involved in cell wall biosynthesis